MAKEYDARNVRVMVNQREITLDPTLPAMDQLDSFARYLRQAPPAPEVALEVDTTRFHIRGMRVAVEWVPEGPPDGNEGPTQLRTWREAQVRVSITVPHRDTGDFIRVETQERVKVLRNIDARGVLATTVRKLVRNLVLHEVEECLRIDGVPWLDPHLDQPPPLRRWDPSTCTCGATAGPACVCP